MLGKSTLHSWAYTVLVTVQRSDYANKVIKTSKEIKVDVQIYQIQATYMNCLINELCKSMFPQSLKTLIIVIILL